MVSHAPNLASVMLRSTFMFEDAESVVTHLTFALKWLQSRNVDFVSKMALLSASAVLRSMSCKAVPHRRSIRVESFHLISHHVNDGGKAVFGTHKVASV